MKIVTREYVCFTNNKQSLYNYSVDRESIVYELRHKKFKLETKLYITLFLSFNLISIKNDLYFLLIKDM